MKNIKTFLLMFLLMLIFVYVGNLMGGIQGIKIAFLVSLALNFYSYFYSDKLVLQHYKAQEVNRNNAPMLYRIVENLIQKANLPMPKVYIIPDAQPNAFATGRNYKHAAVAVTQGLLNLLDENELEGVLAHELSHVKHYDILTGTITAVFASAIGMLANAARYTKNNNSSNNQSKGLFVLLSIVLMPIVATIIRLGVSRTREYEADAGAAYLTQKPQYLASALAKIEGYAKEQSLNGATSETAHMFIINPFKAQQAEFSSLLSTHPSTEERIKRLNALAKELAKDF